jgi:ATP/maltotriose-dependent transcriptional regulator MalT
LLSGWAGGVHSAWYTATRDDASLDALARGLVDALRLRVPGLPADLRTVLTGARGPDAAADELERAQACAAALCQGLQDQLRRDLVLVIDDFQEVGEGTGAVRLVDAICRGAPARLHVVLSSRLEPPFAVDRLRGQGQVLELGGSDLAFTRAETAALLAQLSGLDDEETAEAVHRATGGWAAAVRLAAEALRDVPASARTTALDRIRRPGGPLFGYLAAEVFAHEAPEVTKLVSTLATLERFTPELCEALGLAGADEIVQSLARRGLFVELYGLPAGWFSLGAPVRDYALAQLPLREAERRRVHRVAARWLEEQGRIEEALRSRAAIGDDAGTARLLVRRGQTLLGRGAVDAVAAAERLPAELRDERIEQLAGEALQVKGDWDGALRRFERAAGSSDRLAPALAWRVALIHQLRGRLTEAFAIYDRAVLDGSEPRDVALLLAWRASAHWLRGEADEAREGAARAFELASDLADPQALAAAHTVLAMLAALDGDRNANDAHYLHALDNAEQAGDVLQLIRIRANRGSRHLEEGAYEEAISELDLAVRLADLAGFASFKALALTNRGDARLRLGRLEEAFADLEQARDLYQRLGSRMVAYPLGKPR